MGANFEWTIVDAQGKNELRKQFKTIQDHYCYENGHDPYGGHLGTVRGLHITDEVFDTVNEAVDYIEETHIKWEPPMAVYTPKGYVVGGLMPE